LTTLTIFDIRTVLETIKDVHSLEFSRRVVQAEITFHESRLAQLKELDQAIGERIGKQG
jgi:hypothetical protein